MTPYYQDDWATIYHGDCRDVLLTEVAPVDLILMDLPYGISYVTAWRSREDGLRAPVLGDETVVALLSSWPTIISVLNEDRHWYVFSSPKMLPMFACILTGYKHILAWDKGDRGTVGDLECGFGEAWEGVFYGMKGRRPLNGKRPRTVIRRDWSATMDPVHPTVKPISLLGQFIKWSTNQEEVVLDPFMGSGTTLRAAKNLNRKSIGIEMEEKYCEIAANRLSQEVFDFT
jgi:site-specific DNA-methyltransferase (adenine-specific)